ncbi:MAG: hypothetical protein M1813_003238 [Trichoglossum hirsutum]|nr:MAG: hypothetical protein M1813_003238 [Trichoglossum hirsutum]
MTLPPPHALPLNSTVTGKQNIAAGARPTAAQQSASALGAQQPPAPRRILSPLKTSVSSSSSLGLVSGRSESQNSPSSNLTSSSPSPFASSFSSILSSSTKNPSFRQNVSTPSGASTNSNFQTGSQQLTSVRLLSSTSQTTTNSLNPHLAPSAAASTTASHGGGGGSSGGGGTSRTAGFSPLAQSNNNLLNTTSVSVNTTTTPTITSNNSQAGQLSKIVIAQVFLLLSTIKEDKDKAKWESQADQILKLVESNGMEVFSKYFRRLLVGNSPQIFPGITRAVENPGNYSLLVGELRKVSHDLDQAHKIAETIDTSDGDLFRDFDLSTFMEHFKLDALEKTILSLAFKTVSRADLKTKADAILSNNFGQFLEILSNPSLPEAEKHEDLSPGFLVSIIEQFIRHPPPHLNDEAKANLSYSIRLRYQKQGSQIPAEVATAMQPIDGLGVKQALIRLVQRAGPQCTTGLDTCKNMLRLAGSAKFDEMQVADALVFMVSGQDWQQYDLAVFVAAIREHNLTSEFNWQGVTRAFDREGFRVSQEQFFMLFNALLPIAQEEPNFDIQQLWGGMWRNADAQLSFVAAYSSLPPARLDASKVPRLRRAFTVEDFADASDAVKQYAAGAVSHPMVSLDAIVALLDLGFETPHPPVQQEGPKVFQVVQSNMDIFLCGAFRLPKPWTETQQAIVLNLFYSFLVRQHQAYEFVLHFLWKLDKQWVATRLVEIHSEDPMLLPILLMQAQEQHWLEDLLMILNGFGLDLAALAHRRGIVDLEQWAQSLSPRNPQGFGFAVCRFLKIKAEDEMRTVRHEQDSPKTVSLAVKTVNSLLEILEDLLSESNRGELVTIQRLCIQAYPRLINYGEGFDDIIDNSGEESNAIPASVDEKMQEYYKRMYSADLDVRDIVEALQKYKRSRDPADQDLFACMIHGLFDEYSCYGEYPLEALATTAVLFGGIINFNLVAGIPLRVALGMILEAVRDYSPEDSMYKFGLQALLHFFPRLHEWPGFCSLLLLVPGLRGTEAFGRAEEVIRERANQGVLEAEPNGLPTQNGTSDAPSLTNGNMDDIFHSETNVQRFSSVHVDPPLRPEIYEDPDEDVQDRVLFVLNNISERNLDSKLRDLQEALEDKHHLWFAGYLVEERAKMQPNFHQLYLDMLTMFGDKSLWSEVLRETYVSVIKMLNAESTMLSASERTHLKNLGGWLGSLTIARDKPIKHKNISFKDLLIEGYDTQRLIVVIPFTCKVLIQAAKSTVFKPPNPWTMDIIRLLIELYHFAELKLNLKFEIEVLCKGLNLDYKTIEPSSGIRERPHADDDLPVTLSEGLEGFEDLSLSTLNRSGVRNERFSPGAITSSLPDLESLLVYPPSSSNLISPAHLKRIVQTAIQRAIQEIISPVVERSVTIAGISTSQLIHKDFAMEPNEERVRQSALTMVKALAGSLALVTCKEPLRMSMTNYIRQNLMQNQYPDQALPEGTILMCVNDNLDTACSMVEKAAEERSMPEIEENIEQGLAARRRHRAARPSEPYIDPSVNRWSFYLPEPYRLKPGGLNREQMAIYEEFARQSRGASSHGPSDSARQSVGEVIQEQYPAVPSLPTPAEPPAIPHQAQQQTQQRMQIQPTPSASTVQAPQMNGFTDVKTIVERIHNLLSELQLAAKEAPEPHVKDLSPGSSTMEIFDQILTLVFTTPHREEVALKMANDISSALYMQTKHELEIEILVQLLERLCQISSNTAKEVLLWLVRQDDERMFNVSVTVSLLNNGLMELQRIDMIVAKAIQARKSVAVEFLSRLMDKVLLDERPIALRADFAGSLDALGQWLLEEPDMVIGNQILQKLRDSGMPEVVDRLTDLRSQNHRDQIEYIFSEWIQLCNHPTSTEKSFAAFLVQMHQKKIMSNDNESCTFFRLCIDMSVLAFEREGANPNGSLDDAYIHIDALAKLVVLLVKYQREGDDDVMTSKASYLDSILSLIVLVLNHHHVMRGENFNQKIFFRLFSSIFCEFHAIGQQNGQQHKEIMLVFGDKLLALQPLRFPGFTFGWLSLISHRIFMPGMLLLPDQAGWDCYAKIMETLLAYVGELLKPLSIAGVSKSLYRGILRILLVLHHDFPEFLAENHFRLCGVIPTHCTQLRNLVLSAFPSAFPELPDPFTAGLKVDRLVEIRTPPTVAGDVEGAIRRQNLKEVVDAALTTPGGPTDEIVTTITKAIYNPPTKEIGVAFSPVNVDVALLNSLVLYVGMKAINSVGKGGGPTFTQNSTHATLLLKLTLELNPEARYYFLSAIANQLRYPNSHTHYFSYALLFLFGTDHNDQQESDVRQQITRVLLERLIVHRPHPWGLIITLLELLKNPSYMFWDLPFIKAAPEIERLFGALFAHINQSPR